MNWNDVPEIQEVTTVPLDNYLAELQVVTDKPGDDLLKFQMRKAIRAFTRRSNILLRKVTIPLQPCVEEYPAILLDGEIFNSFQTRRDNLMGVGAHTKCGRYYVKWNVSSMMFSVVPPSVAENAQLLISTTYNNDFCEVDSMLMDRHYDTIINGALSYLYAMKGHNVNWTDASLAMYHAKEFTKGITTAGVDRLSGRSTGGINLKSRRVV